MLKLAGFNSTIYSFNKKTGVSLTPTLLGSGFNPASTTLASLLPYSVLNYASGFHNMCDISKCSKVYVRTQTYLGYR